MVLVKSLMKSLVISGVFAWLVGGTVMSQVNGAQVDPDKLKIDSKPTIIFDKNGDPIFSQFRNDKHYSTEFSEIPKEVVEALIATEDREFFNHSGVSVRGISRAIVADIKAGAFVQGGSTITQQLAKQIYLHPGKTLDRKKEEAVVATTLEQMYSKEEILSFYLDHSFFGYNSYGIEDAVQTYFGQTLEEFKQDDRINRIAKASLVAGLPQAPSTYSPYSNPKSTQKRQHIVLNNMLNQGYITQSEYDQVKSKIALDTDALKKQLEEKAITEKQYRQTLAKGFLVLESPKIVHDEIVKYPEIVTYVLEEARKELELDSQEDVIKKGVSIYTSFDPGVYKEIRKQFENDKNFPANASDGTKVQGSAVFVNPQNGEILALTGARQKETGILNLNRAFQNPRQPGSTIKPVLDYGPAIEYLGWNPWSLVAGSQGIDFGGGYTVKDHGYASQRTMIDALANSNNVPAVWTLKQVGIAKAKKFAEGLGLSFAEKQDNNLAIALGGLYHGNTTLQMADAYQAFANGGLRIEAHMVRKVVDSSGNEIYSNDEKLERVMKEKTANYMKYMLRQVVTSGTGRRANTEPDQMVAGKTGTTEYKTTGANRDIWFVGFTKDYVGAIWMGFDNTDDKHNLWDASGVPAAMFGKIIKPLLKVNPDPASEYTAPSVVKPTIKSFKLNSKLNKEEKKVTLSWAASADSYYKVYRDDSEVEKTEKTSYTDEALEAGKTYAFKVSAFNKVTNFQTRESEIVLIKIPIDEPEEKPAVTPKPTKPAETPKPDDTKEPDETDEKPTKEDDDKSSDTEKETTAKKKTEKTTEKTKE